MTIYVNCDGGSRGNPGPAACAYIIKDENHQLLGQAARYLGIATNNQAEYQAVIEAIKYLISRHDWPISSLTFHLDSLLVVNQLKGLYKVKDPVLQSQNIQIKTLIREHRLPHINWCYIPRWQNSHADSLVNHTLDHHQ